jgi:hypothetical protein
LTDPAKAKPLGVYVHWPYCARICPYCDFNVVRDRGKTDEQAALADAIVADLIAQRALTGPRTAVDLLRRRHALADGSRPGRPGDRHRQALWSPAADLEISLEANPTDAETDRFAALADAGVATAVAGRPGAERRVPEGLAGPQPRRRRGAAGDRRRDQGLPAPVGRPDLRPPRPDGRRLARRAPEAIASAPSTSRPTS